MNAMMVCAVWFAAAMMFLTFFVKDSLLMRGFGILANIGFIAYGSLGIGSGVMELVLPILLLHAATLGVNLCRFRSELERRGCARLTARMTRRIGASLVLLRRRVAA